MASAGEHAEGTAAADASTATMHGGGASLQASLPLYRLPELEEAKSSFWQALATELGRAGCDLAPAALDLLGPAVPARIEPGTLFTQLCGYPMLKLFGSQVRVLAAPVYDAARCEGATHCGVFVVAAEAPFDRLADLRGGTFVFGGPMSNSGMNLPRRALAEVAGATAFFREAIETDSQVGNLEAVAAGTMDGTCVDTMTFEYVAAHRPDLAAALRILCATPSSPSIPFVTSASTDAATVGLLREALASVARSPEWSEVRAGLRLADIVPAKMADYEMLLGYEESAAALGYPELR